MLYLERRYDEALVAARKALDLDPTYVSPYACAALAHGAKGELAQAIEFAETAAGLTKNWRSMMQACVEERNSLLPYLDAPWNDAARDDPFIHELRRKLGLPAPRETPRQSL